VVVVEVTVIDSVAFRARAWLDDLLALPSAPVLRTRAIARQDLIDAVQPGRIQLEPFIEAWYSADTQSGLRALMASLGK
jgi:hypothetical protein